MARDVSHPTELMRLARSMHVRELGPPDARTVVMVHGFVVSGEYFLPTVERLPAGLFAVLPDLPGFGKSPRPSWTLTVPQLATVLLEWLGSRPGGTLVANSFGCQVAAEAAMRRPDLIDRLVLVSPALDPGKRRLRRILPALVRETRSQSGALRRLLLRHYLRTDPRRVIGTLRHALWDRMEDKLPLIEIPTLVVWGTADPVVSRRWAETATSLLPRGRMEIVEGAPHAMNFDAPADLAAAISDFLTPQEAKL